MSATAQGRLLVIVGPTAIGKSELALRAALEGGGEIVSADSMQVYRYFDIGTGKVPERQRCGVPHHLIDVVDPNERFSAAEFVKLADQAVAAIRARGRVPVIVGGTGLYVRALLWGLFEAPPPDLRLRAEHEALAASGGVPALHGMLAGVDNEAAARIDVNDFVRISRALEVYQQTGEPISKLQRAHSFARRRHSATVIGLRISAERLREAIESRVDAMMSQGWLAEVRDLCERGFEQSHPMGALGYRQLAAHLGGELELDQAVLQTKRETWRFSRRQRNWFSQERDVQWLDCEADPELVLRVLESDRG